MTTTSKLAFGTLIAALGGLGTLPANAQDEAVGASTEMATEPTPEEAEAAAEEAAAKEDPMGWFGIGLKLGWGGIGESEVDNPLYDEDTPIPGVDEKITTDSRSGFQLAIPINLGGDGFSWDIEPYFNFDSDATAYGGYTGPFFNIHILDPLYVGFGFGLKGAYLGGDGLDFGADVYGRVPIRGTYYLLEDIGLVAELGLGYGVSGYKFENTGLTGTAADELDIEYGSAFTWDFTVGARWP